MTTYKLRLNQNDEFQEFKYDSHPILAAQAFAAEEELEDGVVVEIEGHGKYIIDVVLEPTYNARKIK